MVDAHAVGRVYRYDFDPAPFEPWTEAPGQWIAASAVAPIAVTLLTDLIGLHAEADVELRLVPSLWPLTDVVNDDRWDFSIVRMGNAAPRTGAAK